MKSGGGWSGLQRANGGSRRDGRDFSPRSFSPSLPGATPQDSKPQGLKARAIRHKPPSRAKYSSEFDNRHEG